MDTPGTTDSVISFNSMDVSGMRDRFLWLKTVQFSDASVPPFNTIDILIYSPFFTLNPEKINYVSHVCITFQNLPQSSWLWGSKLSKYKVIYNIFWNTSFCMVINFHIPTMIGAVKHHLIFLSPFLRKSILLYPYG